jgi:hypothetical protein
VISFVGAPQSHSAGAQSKRQLLRRLLLQIFRG